ncbi:MAG: hypothetical protein R3A13_05305 [Bdellovibrionota bacterium]
MRLDVLAKTNISAAIAASVGARFGKSIEAPEIETGVQATYTAVKKGGVYAQEMTFESSRRAEIKLEDNTAKVQKNPLDSIASEIFASEKKFERGTESFDSSQKAKAVEAYTQASLA